MNDDIIKKEIGLRIKSFRNDNNYTQEKFSELIGLDQGNLSKIETGKNFPDITTLCDMIILADIEPNYLLNFMRNKQCKYETIDTELMALFVNLPEDIKKPLKTFLLTLQK